MGLSGAGVIGPPFIYIFFTKAAQIGIVRHDYIWYANEGDVGSISGPERSPGGGNGNPLLYSCLENPMDRGAWWATVQGVAKSWAQLSAQHFHFSDTNKMQALRFLEIISLGALRLDPSDRFPLASI